MMTRKKTLTTYFMSWKMIRRKTKKKEKNQKVEKKENFESGKCEMIFSQFMNGFFVIPSFLVSNPNNGKVNYE
jgi:hypothetical protein